VIDAAAAERAGGDGGEQARPGQRPGVDHADVEPPVAQARAVRGRHPGRLIPAVAREIQPEPAAAPIQHQFVRPGPPQHGGQRDEQRRPPADGVLELLPGVHQVGVDARARGVDERPVPGHPHIDQDRLARPQRGQRVIGRPHAQVGSKVIERAGRDHQKRQAGLQRDASGRADRPVTAGDAQDPRGRRRPAQPGG